MAETPERGEGEYLLSSLELDHVIMLKSKIIKLTLDFSMMT